MDMKQDGMVTPPAKLMQAFTASRFLLWIGVALAAHAVVIGGCSVGYIRDTYIDPEGAALRKAAAEAALKAAQTPAAPAAAPTQQVAKAVATNAAPTSAESMLEARQDTPIVKAITEKPAAGEIPAQPDDLGISIQDTNVK